jgi:hypothetical protein
MLYFDITVEAARESAGRRTHAIDTHWTTYDAPIFRRHALHVITQRPGLAHPDFRLARARRAAADGGFWREIGWYRYCSSATA